MLTLNIHKLVTALAIVRGSFTINECESMQPEKWHGSMSFRFYICYFDVLWNRIRVNVCVYLCLWYLIFDFIQKRADRMKKRWASTSANNTVKSERKPNADICVIWDMDLDPLKHLPLYWITYAQRVDVDGFTIFGAAYYKYMRSVTIDNV